MAEPSPSSAQSFLQLYNIAAAISSDLASDFARLAGFSVAVPELAPIVGPLKRIDAWSQKQTSHRESCRNLLHRALKVVALISERYQDGQTDPSKLSPTIEQTVTDNIDIWTHIPPRMSSYWHPRIEETITEHEEHLKSFFDHLSEAVAIPEYDGTTTREWKVQESPVDHWVPGDMEEPVHGDSQPGFSEIIHNRLNSEVPETTDKKDDRPPVPGHSRDPTSRSHEDGISRVDSLQPDYPANQGAGGAADLEKWINFITVVPDQDGRFKSKIGSRPVYGGFSDVWECDAKFSDGTTISVAVKKFRAVHIPHDADENAVTSKLLKRLSKELRIWMNLNHRNITPLLGFVLSGDFCMISPWYANGNVASYISRHPEADRIKLVSDVACGLAYLHSRALPVIHGDMKPDNVLIDETGDAVIIDFGLSSVMETETTLATSFTSASLQDAGNPRWMAPELLMEEGCARSLSTDIYSFGCVALYIYTGEIPFKGIPNTKIIHTLIRGRKPVTNRNDYPAVSSLDAEWFYRLLVSCWDAEPSSRPSIGTVEERMRSGDTTKGIDVITAQDRSSPALPKTTSTATPISANLSSSPSSDPIITSAAAPLSSTPASTTSMTPGSMSFGSKTASRTLPTRSRNLRLEPYTSKMAAPYSSRPPARKQTSIVQLLDIPVVVSVETVFDTARLAACCVPVPGLAAVVEILRTINASVERVSWNKGRCRKLSTKAMTLVFIICDHYDNERTDTAKMQTAIERTVQAMHDIDLDVRAWATLSFWKSWYARHEVDSKIVKHEDNLKSLTEFLLLAATFSIHDKIAALQETLKTHPSGSADLKRAQEQLYRLRNAPRGELADLTQDPGMLGQRLDPKVPILGYFRPSLFLPLPSSTSTPTYDFCVNASYFTFPTPPETASVLPDPRLWRLDPKYPILGEFRPSRLRETQTVLPADPTLVLSVLLWTQPPIAHSRVLLTPPELVCECVRLGSQPEYSGTRNDIWKGRWLDKQDIALILYKQYKMGVRDENGIRRFEGKIKCREDWIIPMYSVFMDGASLKGKRDYLVSPWLWNRDVLKYLDGDRGRSKKCLALITEIALGLRYLHSQGIIHGSLEPSNILVQDDGHAVLSDFSLANLAPPDWKDTMIQLEVDNLRYQAPEVILDEPISKASDNYSWAMTALEIMTGDPPFHTWKSPGQLVPQILQSQIPNRSDYKSPVLDKHPEIWNLFVRSWSRQPLERPMAKEIVEVLESITAHTEY
ncbi:hypothetical protein FRC05_006995 [Tulasnella sp. 425]|nr:hypothetical protein FRC05_006995 [Tulasnella sp. 425]